MVATGVVAPHGDGCSAITSSRGATAGRARLRTCNCVAALTTATRASCSSPPLATRRAASWTAGERRVMAWVRIQLDNGQRTTDNGQTDNGKAVQRPIGTAQRHLTPARRINFRRRGRSAFHCIPIQCGNRVQRRKNGIGTASSRSARNTLTIGECPNIFFGRIGRGARASRLPLICHLRRPSSEPFDTAFLSGHHRLLSLLPPAPLRKRLVTSVSE